MAIRLRATFEAVYETHFAFVWRSLRRLGVADSAVEDVAQEVFLVVHRRLASFDGRSSIKPWLFAIIVRVVSDARRSLRRKRAHLGGHARSDQDVDSVTDPSAICPQKSAERADAVRTLRALLDRIISGPQSSLSARAGSARNGPYLAWTNRRLLPHAAIAHGASRVTTTAP